MWLLADARISRRKFGDGALFLSCEEAETALAVRAAVDQAKTTAATRD
jgi:hypothetical protein